MKIISERLRQEGGFVGKTVYDTSGVKYVQVSRSPSIGTIVCVGLDENDNPKIGWALISPDEVYKLTSKENVLNGEPGISWEASYEIAKERALKFENGKPSDDNPNIPSYLNSQLKHFKERCKSYYNPEKYSKKNKVRPGKLLKVWINDNDETFDSDLVKNMSYKE